MSGNNDARGKSEMVRKAHYQVKPALNKEGAHSLNTPKKKSGCFSTACTARYKKKYSRQFTNGNAKEYEN